MFFFVTPTALVGRERSESSCYAFHTGMLEPAAKPGIFCVGSSETPYPVKYEQQIGKQMNSLRELN